MTITKMSRAIEYLQNHQSASTSKWKESAQWRRDNERWLKYARFITMKIMKAMDEQSVTQTVLAQRMGCTQQYVSNMLKGSSNMTLETISRIEDALGIDIIQSSMNYVAGYSAKVESEPCYLSDNESPSYGSK